MMAAAIDFGRWALHPGVILTIGTAILPWNKPF